MPPLSRRKGVLAFAKQSALGTAATVPGGGLGDAALNAGAASFALPIVSGGMAPMQDRADLPTTRDTAARPGQYVQRARGEGTVTVLCYPDALGLLLYEVMGAQTASSLVGPPATERHIFAMNDALPLPLTVWSLVGDDWWRFTDTFVNRVTLRGESGANCTAELELTSFQARHLIAAEAPSYVIKDTDFDRYKYIGSTVELDADAIASTSINNVESVELEINRNPEYRYGPSLTPSIIVPEREINFSAHLTYDPLQQGWDFLTGAYLKQTHAQAAAASSDVTQDFLSGSFYVNFGRHPVDPARGLFIASGPSASGTPIVPAPTEQNWDYAITRPEADPGGGPLEYDLQGPVRDPGTAGSEITVYLYNDLSGSY